MPEKNEIVTENYNWKKSKRCVKIKKGTFDLDTTPLKFRNCLTLSLTEDFKEPIYYDFGFWISEIQEMGAQQLVGGFMYKACMDSTDMNSLYHPYKSENRFFILDK